MSFSTTRPLGPVPVMRDGSMTQTRAKAAARGLMRNSDGADGRVAEGWNDETGEAWTGWGNGRGTAADGAPGGCRRSRDGADGGVEEGWNDEPAEAWTGGEPVRGAGAAGAVGPAAPTS